MESRFSKYKNESEMTSSQIANINNFIDWCYDEGLDLIEKEIQSLKRLIARGENNKMFPKKIDQLIAFGEKIEEVHDSYHFKRDDKEN